MKIAPVTLAEAKKFVGERHRHNKPPCGWKLGAGLLDDEQNIVGVVIVSRPVARHLDTRFNAEIVRCCTDGTRNACSMRTFLASL